MTIEIQLTKGQVAIVDDCDADLAELNWHATRSRGAKTSYAARRIWTGYKAQTNEWLHKVILARALGRPLVKGEQTDHINRYGLDNRRENLRLATVSQNQSNKSMSRNNTSGFKGVSLLSRKWRAGAKINGKPKYLGMFDNIIDAAIAYDRAVYEFHGEFAQANFPPFACGLST